MQQRSWISKFYATIGLSQGNHALQKFIRRDKVNQPQVIPFLFSAPLNHHSLSQSH
ncbi:hypothetical protein D1BOALGB6SA_7135 [Olavius sp. associated proteobacterium Delta 1]|nr:hypothetical protein D1BOALGB6SA_7135 [Olavius sp. associated proteobacterium Delta 1]